MSKQIRILAALAIVVLAQGVASAAETMLVSIRVTDMHCGNCARKIASRLVTVPGVVKVTTDLSKHTATITPQQEKQPSPKALWEAVEKAGFKPVQLDGPAGSFKAKPTT